MDRLKKTLVFLVAGFMLFTSCKNNNPGRIVASSNDAIAVTASGSVAGYIDDGIYTFKGIPYAKAERFMPPEEPYPWKDTLSCRNYGPKAPQSTEFRSDYRNIDQFIFQYNMEYEDEKDLFSLNIWTPGLNDGKKRPVFVWLHGGGFFAGSGHNLDCYDGRSLAQKGDIVVVNLNHRLNVLGFLDLSSYSEKYEKSANVSVLDMVMALKWVHNNIGQFGGDPGNVTIAGQSGGGAKVMTLLVTPAAKGLFQKAIIQSGTVMGSTMASKENTQKFGEAVIHEVETLYGQADKITEISYAELHHAVLATSVKHPEIPVNLLSMGPSIDGKVLPFNLFSSEANSLFQDIPILIGTTFNEMGPRYYRQEITREKAIEILQDRYGNGTGKFIGAFEKAYPEGSLQDLLSVDMNARLGAIETSGIISGFKGAPVYIYLFSWKSPVMDGSYASCHNMELPFVFNNIALQRELTGSVKEAYELADKMSSAWISFIKNGNPNGKGLPEWEDFTPETNATMIFNNKCVLKKNHDKDMLELAASHPDESGTASVMMRQIIEQLTKQDNNQ